jgi:acetyl esterase/lipase
MKKIFFLLVTLAISLSVLKAQEYRHQNEINIWPNGAPGSNQSNWPWEGYAEQWRIDSASNKEMVIFVTEPSIQVFLPAPEKNTGAAVVVCPGGGYNIVVIGKEGYDIAERLNDLGIAAIVLKYRHYDVMAARDDAQRALRYTRYHAGDWHIDPGKIGIGGFSAGGHLALHATATIDAPLPAGHHADDVDKISNRPDFMMLIYPGTGLPAGTELNPDLPPAFIAVAGDDGMMPLSLNLFRDLKALKVPAELHIFQGGGHGFGAGTPECHCADWIELFRNWLEANSIIG